MTERAFACRPCGFSDVFSTPTKGTHSHGVNGGRVSHITMVHMLFAGLILHLHGKELSRRNCLVIDTQKVCVVHGMICIGCAFSLSSNPLVYKLTGLSCS